MLSPKQIGTICFAIFSFIFSAPLFAVMSCDSSLNGDCPDCVNSNLQTYSGTSNIQATWEPNTIALHWYNGDTEIQNVPVASQSCVYDDSLTPPSTIPTRTGYTFKGWRVKQFPQCNLSGLDASVYGTWRASKNSTGYCYYWNSDTGDGVDGDCSDSHFAGLNNSEWETNFSYGTVKGMAKCSNTNGTWATVGNPSNTNGKYCWCAATSYVPNGGTQCNVVSPSWVFIIGNGSASGCAGNCASYCADDVSNDDGFRRAVFGVSQ